MRFQLWLLLIFFFIIWGVIFFYSLHNLPLSLKYERKKPETPTKKSVTLPETKKINSFRVKKKDLCIGKKGFVQCIKLKHIPYKSVECDMVPCEHWCMHAQMNYILLFELQIAKRVIWFVVERIAKKGIAVENNCTCNFFPYYFFFNLIRLATIALQINFQKRHFARIPL